MEKLPASYWTTVIQPKRRWFDLNIRELIQYRDLILLLVKRNFTLVYKQTMLGPLWVLIQPLLTSSTFSVVFGVIAGLPTDGVPSFLFYLCGSTAWSYFANCLNSTSNTFISYKSLFSKVYFPRMAVPVAVVLSEMITFLVQFAFFLIMLVITVAQPGSTVRPNWGLIALSPVLLLQMCLLGLGFGLIVAALTTRYRDLRLLVRFGISLWMYATPVAYASSLVSQRFPGFEWIYMINPMTPVIELFRAAYLGTEIIDVRYWLLSGGITLAVFLIGVMLFSRMEKTFMDTI